MAQLLNDNQRGLYTVKSIKFDQIPLTALSHSTRCKLSHMLNKKRFFRSDSGNEKDWRGLSVLSEQQNYIDIKTADDPTQQVIYWWCKNNPKTATIAYLETFLNVIDRSDVYEDIYELILEDVKAYKMKSSEVKAISHISRTSADFRYSTACNENVKVLRTDPNILTKGDVDRAQSGLPPQLYDAFLLYADADFSYASEMIRKLENENNLKLCLKDRDLLAGVSFAHVALTQLIEERCQHLIVILTKHFIESPENEFLVHYAQASQIEHKTRKILPVVYEDEIVIPRTLKIYTQLYYNNTEGILIDFWTKLAYSIKRTNILHKALPTTSDVIRSVQPSDQLLPKTTLEQEPMSGTNIENVKAVQRVALAESANSKQIFSKSKLKLPRSSTKLFNGHCDAQLSDNNRPLIELKDQKKAKTRKNLINCLRKFSIGVKQ